MRLDNWAVREDNKGYRSSKMSKDRGRKEVKKPKAPKVSPV
jgi:hypothetical protein